MNGRVYITVTAIGALAGGWILFWLAPLFLRDGRPDLSGLQSMLEVSRLPWITAAFSLLLAVVMMRFGATRREAMSREWHLKRDRRFRKQFAQRAELIGG